ncbi:hypothetical protein GUITHDRAFT_134466 [Guillardia theta CCMP2712]|uniref:Uncharacterized protein n=1 Tax=Guillardia theta (strain CCMP2712) TaxID=905079 RepID=L1JTA9_GUITC|nr:hypothetical protein GUITHDRAFT_134466 [Guillardia theta CCMP2712]EKX51559.1 hypothetical protein GUITHDRAFT_134466 [Guillardia theta CCMP2712]|eukprot:XP_005838539.1 hypothetical protein GUITHDRAFT_134466 [Guillardia theta CCMP2712]
MASLASCPAPKPRDGGPIALRVRLNKDEEVLKPEGEEALRTSLKEKLRGPLIKLGMHEQCAPFKVGQIIVGQNCLVVEVIIPHHPENKVEDILSDEKIEEVASLNMFEGGIRAGECQNRTCLETRIAMADYEESNRELIKCGQKVDAEMREYIEAQFKFDTLHQQMYSAEVLADQIERDLKTFEANPQLVQQITARQTENDKVLQDCRENYDTTKAALAAADEKFLENKLILARAQCITQHRAQKMEQLRLISSPTCPCMIPQAFVCQKNCGYSGIYEDVAEHETSCKGIEYTCSL